MSLPDIPELVRNKARAAGANGWVEQLPALIADLEREWSMTVGAPYQDGTEAFVTRVTLEDGVEAVLKILVPRSGDDELDHTRNEATALRLVNGEGCARLLRDDVERGALLMERLGRSLHERGLPAEERHEILCATAMRVWRPAPESGLPTGAEKGRWLIDFITRTWEALDRPCSEQAVDYALRCAERRIGAHDDERAVLVHGDIHQWNALEADGGYRFVDPDGLLAEAEYDLGILMREDPVELIRGDPHDRARWLAERAGLDPVAIWEWGVVERVSSGLLCTSIDLQPFGRQMLDAAEVVARLPGFRP